MSRAIALSAVGLLAVTGCGDSEGNDPAADTPADPVVEGGPDDGPAVPVETSEPAEEQATATATLTDVDGTELGTVTFTEVNTGMEVSAQVEGMEQGFYGFHVHGTGLCEPDSAAPDDPSDTGPFLSAGGHLGVDDADHGAHAGDLPSLYVMSSGAGSLTFVTDAFDASTLMDDDGSAVMVHDGMDNFANIPDRYAPDGPDQETLDTGDAGSRLACGVVE